MTKQLTLDPFIEAQEKATIPEPRLIQGVLGEWPDCINRHWCNQERGIQDVEGYVCAFLAVGPTEHCGSYVPVGGVYET